MTDEELRALPHVNCPIAAEYLGIPQNHLRGGIERKQIPVGSCVRGPGGRRSVTINVEALIAYKHGQINTAYIAQYDALEARVEKIEKRLKI